MLTQFKNTFFILLLFSLSAQAQSDFSKIFKQHQVGGSTTVYELDSKKWTFTNKKDAVAGTRPASTFKIINSLIALEEGIVKDEYELLPWIGIDNVDTAHYGNRPEIFKDMSLAEAMEKSAVWYHIELAKKIGREKYIEYFKKCNYGNLDFSAKGVDFWNNGPFAITPVGQIKFLEKLYLGKLPFSERTISIVKKIMLTESGSDYSIHAKTGMGMTAESSFGWWVGYIEKNKKVYFFATRIQNNSTEFSPAFAQNRKEITKEVLRVLHILE